MVFDWEACGIFAPQPGMEPTPPALEDKSLNHCTTQEVPIDAFVLKILVYSEPFNFFLMFFCSRIPSRTSHDM